jgi:leucyl aminopeptidase
MLFGYLLLSAITVSIPSKLLFENTYIDDSNLRLISTAPDQAKWMTEDEIMKLYADKISFIDITDGDLDFSNVPQPISNPDFPDQPHEQTYVEPMLKLICEKRLKSFLTNFTSFQNRYCNFNYNL